MPAQTNWAETTLDGFACSSDWRLPSLDEYIALFGAYGNLAEVPAFKGVVNRALYWSSAENPLDQASALFRDSRGIWGRTLKSEKLCAVAVRSGDVAVSVPVRQMLALALLALGATLVACRRRAH